VIRRIINDFQRIYHHNRVRWHASVLPKTPGGIIFSKAKKLIASEHYGREDFGVLCIMEMD
jgi:hypothetical protein